MYFTVHSQFSPAPPSAPLAGDVEQPTARSTVPAGLLSAGRLLQLEPDLQAHLEVRDLPVDDVPADLGDLEPVQPAQRGGGPADGIADGVLNGLGRGPDELGHPVGVIHGGLPSVRQPAVPDRLPGTDRRSQSSSAVAVPAATVRLPSRTAKPSPT